MFVYGQNMRLLLPITIKVHTYKNEIQIYQYKKIKKCTINISRLRAVIKKNHIIEKYNNNYAVKHSYGTMTFDIKRYKYKFKNEIQIFIYQEFKVMSL